MGIQKIEGRGRAADYVDTTVRCYREAVACLQEGTYTAEKVDAWMEQLATVYNRGFWDGYYLGRKMGEWNDSYGSKATERKIYIGRGVKYYPRVQVGEFRMESHSLKTGDTVMITGPDFGVVKTEVQELRVDDRTVEAVEKGDVFSIKTDRKIRASAKLYKIVPA